MSNAQTLNVTLGLTLFELIEINEHEEFVRLKISLKQWWTDFRLAWNSSDYDHIGRITVRPDRIWTPDVVLYNDVEDGGNMDSTETRIRVTNTGRVYWSNSIVTKTRCKMNVGYFPFDKQHCFLRFGSWIHSIDQIHLYGDVEQNAERITLYEANHEWNIVGSDTKSQISTYVSGDYTEIDFCFDFQRRSLFYTINLLFPIVMITLLTVMVFVLPEESGERMGVAVTLLMLAVTVFMLLLADTMPSSSASIPLAGIFFIFCISGMFLMIISLCVVSRLYHRTTTDPPMNAFTRKYVYDRLSFVVGVRCRLPKSGEMDNKVLLDGVSIEHAITDYHEKQMDNNSNNNNKNNTNNNYNSNDGNNESRNDQPAYTLEEEWCIVGKTIDRCLFIFFVFAFIVGCIGCFATTTYVK